MTEQDSPEIVCLTNGQFQENCYLVADPASGEAVIIDPGEDTAMFFTELDRHGWTLQAIWLTHAHVDHVAGVAAVKATTGVPVYLHPNDRPLYDQVSAQGAWLGMQAPNPPPPDRELRDGDRLSVGRFEFTVTDTPGHSPGSVSFHGDGVVFGGDVLFRDSVGRIDLPGGDAATLLASIRDRFLTLSDETVVYSGHGPPTTIGYERTRNPFLTGAIPLA
jgi:hydroxyacylglutathione hydrolase